MRYDNMGYTCLVVSSSEKVADAIAPLLTEAGCTTVVRSGNASAAKRLCLETQFDFVIINAPLTDDFGAKLAAETCSGRSTVCLLLVGADRYEGLRDKMTASGVFLLPKPMSAIAVTRSLSFMAAARERLRNLEKKTLTIEERMEQIRLVNKAKWLLIENLKMTEPDAHHYIEKQAMDTCVSKSDIARQIIKTYA